MFNLYYPSVKAEMQNLLNAETVEAKEECLDRVISLLIYAKCYTLNELKAFKYETNYASLSPKYALNCYRAAIQERAEHNADWWHAVILTLLKGINSHLGNLE